MNLDVVFLLFYSVCDISYKYWYSPLNLITGCVCIFVKKKERDVSNPLTRLLCKLFRGSGNMPPKDSTDPQYV